MASLQGPVVCPVIRAKQTGMYSVPVNSPLLKAKLIRSGFWGIKGLTSGGTGVGYRQNSGKCRKIRCSFSSSSNGNGSMAGNSNVNDADFVNSSVVEAVEVRSGPDGFMIKMRDGRHLRCVHNSPQGGHLLDYAPHPAIVLKMEDGTGLLLPIIVLEMPSVLLMAAVRNVQIVRPTVYQVVKNMIEKMGYTAKLVRVTKRVREAYFAELHLVKLDNAAECVSFDLRPSDAINIAVQCKVPIQVNKFLAYSDGMRVIDSAKVPMQSPAMDLFMELDRPTGKPCIETKEFDLVRNMLIAAVEERYRDAGNFCQTREIHFQIVLRGGTSSLNFGPRGIGLDTLQVMLSPWMEFEVLQWGMTDFVYIENDWSGFFRKKRSIVKRVILSFGVLDSIQKGYTAIDSSNQTVLLPYATRAREMMSNEQILEFYA
ncbi:hypothetical protein BUALT_Bualt01G0029600 [Buddleja alternifolia]|uniref:BFN domain-containing protein n=1 Tax=Buddleja alternifolia TaxID=168488 RepID=A0AAV6YEY9_9LAMI|nr:hypothetical protein BUALT_Bualt01G0029600 [Buddleja alternifolia]